jgi:hypothetical protein
VIRGEVDRQRPGKYGIDIVQWWYMQLSNFTSQPIGSPLRARRMLMKDVCPVVPDKQIPDVEITPILQIPKGPKDIWAEKDLERIFLALQSGSSDGSFTRGADAVEPPFSVAMAAENKMTKSKVVVFGGGLSLRDDYQQQRVVRFGGKGTRLVTDPPPTENVELFTNALYWLVDRPEMIAAGPPEVPRVEPIEESGYWPMKLVIGAWAFAALVLGGVVMLVRRK